MHTIFFDVQEVELPYLQPYSDIIQYTQSIQDVDQSAYADAEVISVFVHSRVDQKVLEGMPKLQRILTRSTGTDHIDMAYCATNQITVQNVPAYGEHTVAEYAFTMMLTASRKVHEACVRTTQSAFHQDGLMGTDLFGKTLGVVGTGRIGEHMIRIAHGFGMRVLAYDVVANPKCQEHEACTYVSLAELFAGSDVVSIHVPLTEETRHMINGEAFSRMKEGVIVVNTARGGVVDSQALLHALDSQKVAYACLDVLEGEELLRDQHVTPAQKVEHHPEDFDTLALANRLVHHRNVLYTPHIAYYTKEAMGRIMEETLRNLGG